jgi:uncharacterized protein YoxC
MPKVKKETTIEGVEKSDNLVPVGELSAKEQKIVDDIMVASGKVKPVCYNVKQVGESDWAVVDKSGEVVRVYKQSDGIDTPKECAEAYAKKLSK